jgi:uncharacterized protein
MIHKNIIKRPIYTEQILPWIDKTDVAKVYIWQRRSGKSTIMDLIVSELRERGVAPTDIISINCEDISLSGMTTLDLYDRVKDTRHILIDEIQDVPEWERTIRSLIAEWGHDIHITGSNSNLLSGELATYLSGRYVSFHIYPLSYREYVEFRGSTHSREMMTEFITYGGLPYVVELVDTPRLIRDYLSSVYDSIVLHDIVARYGVRNIDFFQRLFVFLAQSIWDIFSAQSITRYLRSQRLTITPHVVLNYLEYARAALFIHKVSRYDLIGKVLFEVREKYFFNDLWLRNLLTGWLRDTDLDGILENLIFLELRKAWWSVFVGEIWKRELDFVAEKDGHTMYVQCMLKYNDKATWERELSAFREIRDGWPRYIVSLYEGDGSETEWVRWMSASDFCWEIAT